MRGKKCTSEQPWNMWQLQNGEQENLFIEVMLKYQMCLTHRSGESPGTQSNES